jgi:hypothetical protein
MKILDAEWFEDVNRLIIECNYCGCKFDHRADRWIVECPCGQTADLGNLRDKPFANEEED